MKTLEIAYKILYSLEHSEKPEYMGQIISPAALGVSQEDWIKVLRTLIEEGYVSGITIKKNIIGDTKVDISNAHITLSGAEYLQENSGFAKFREIATDVISIAAGVAGTAGSINGLRS